jgi:hypothetical protein
MAVASISAGCSAPARPGPPNPLVPAKAGTQGNMVEPECWALDSRFRGNERNTD